MQDVSSQLSQIVQSAVTSAVEPLIQTINKQNEVIDELKTNNIKLSSDNDKLKSDIGYLTAKIEDLEQYGRRTSLRFHNVPMSDADLPRTDKIVTDIINNKIGITSISEDDINRSHIIGDITNGKGQIICRFRNWKIKNMVYQNKKALKGNQDGIFVTEDLTRFRQKIISKLNKLKKTKHIDSFWTSDGRIFLKEHPDDEKFYVKELDDVVHLLGDFVLDL